VGVIDFLLQYSGQTVVFYLSVMFCVYWFFLREYNGQAELNTAIIYQCWEISVLILKLDG
jgi:hypothetical protein